MIDEYDDGFAVPIKCVCGNQFIATPENSQQDEDDHMLYTVFCDACDADMAFYT